MEIHVFEFISSSYYIQILFLEFIAILDVIGIHAIKESFDTHNDGC